MPVREESESMRKKLIVGIDPGTTTAIVLLDLDGDLVDAKQKKPFSLSEITNYLSEQGDPVIIASDVDHPPRLVRKVAATFDARLFYPKEILPVERKIRMASKKFKGEHERDAYAAARSAYENFQPGLKKISADAEKEGMGDYSDEIKASVITGTAQNTQSAIEAVRAKSLAAKNAGQEYAQEIKRKNVEISRLRNEIKRLELAEKDRKPILGADPLSEMQRLRAMVEKQRKELSNIRERERAMEKIMSLVSGGWLPARVIKSLRDVKRQPDLGGWIVILNSDDADEDSIKAVEQGNAKIICSPNKRIKSSGINYIDIGNVNFRYFGDFAAIDGKSVEKEARKGYDRKKIEELVERFKESRQRQ